MEHDRVNLIATCQPGKEKRVLTDILDAIFPYDHTVKGSVKASGRVVIETKLSPDMLRNIFRRYPIRGLQTVRMPLAYYESWEDLTENIASLLKTRGITISRVSISKIPGWCQENYSILKMILKELFNKQDSSIIIIEEDEGKIAVEVILFRLTYDSFSHHAKI